MLFDFFRFRRQAPTTKPPKGYYDLRVSKSTGALVLVDNDGTEATIGSVTSVAGRTGAVTIASADITDITSDGITNNNKALKTDENGNLTLEIVSLGSTGFEGSLHIYGANGDVTVSDGGGDLTASRVLTPPDATGVIALQAANQGAITQADGSDAASTQALANVLKADVNTLLAAMKASKAMAAD